MNISAGVVGTPPTGPPELELDELLLELDAPDDDDDAPPVLEDELLEVPAPLDEALLELELLPPGVAASSLQAATRSTAAKTPTQVLANDDVDMLLDATRVVAVGFGTFFRKRDPAPG